MKLTKEQKQEILDQQSQKNITKRVTSPELEKILYEAVPILDHGFVRVVEDPLVPARVQSPTAHFKELLSLDLILFVNIILYEPNFTARCLTTDFAHLSSSRTARITENSVYRMWIVCLTFIKISPVKFEGKY